MPVRPIRPRTTSLAVTPKGSSPSTVTARSRSRFCGRHCVARTISTSDVPMPKASAPNAPWVEVCESPQTISIPGWVRPSSGPMTCTMPWRRLPTWWSGMPSRRQFSARTSICRRDSSSAARTPPLVGTLWSMVATVRSGRRTLRPASSSPFEGLGRGHLVDQVEVHVEKIRLFRHGTDNVRVPELLGERARRRVGGLRPGVLDLGHGREPHSTGPRAALSVAPVQRQGRRICVLRTTERRPASLLCEIHMVANARVLVVLLGILGLIGLGRTGARAT
jgi:hypothetical protein